MDSNSWSSIFRHGMNFNTDISVECLKIYIGQLRYYRKGTFRVKLDLSNPKIKQVYYLQYLLLSFENDVVTIYVNCYMNRTLMNYVNNFLMLLDINCELYLRRKQPRLRRNGTNKESS